MGGGGCCLLLSVRVAKERKKKGGSERDGKKKKKNVSDTTTVPSTVVPRQNSRFLLFNYSYIDPNEKLGGRIGSITSRRGILWEQYKGKNLDFCLGTIVLGTVVHRVHDIIVLSTEFFLEEMAFVRQISDL
jgi:hypothetical protein